MLFRTSSDGSGKHRRLGGSKHNYLPAENTALLEDVDIEYAKKNTLEIYAVNINVDLISESLNEVKGHVWKPHRSEIQMDVIEIQNDGQFKEQKYSMKALHRTIKKKLYKYHSWEEYADENVINGVIDCCLRDLRRIEPSWEANDVLTLMVRKGIIIFSLEPIRAVIFSDSIFLILSPNFFVTKRERFIKMIIEYCIDWNESMNQNETTRIADYPFELYIIEAFLTIIKTWDNQRYVAQNQKISKLLSHIRQGSLINFDIQDSLSQMKNEVQVLRRRLSACITTLSNFSENDEDMAYMNLSEFDLHPELYLHPLPSSILRKHEIVEDLFEGFQSGFNGIVCNIDIMLSSIHHAEQQLSQRLESTQNILLVVTTILGLFLNFISFCAYIAGIFGMNLDNAYEGSGIYPNFQGNNYDLFLIVCIILISLIIVVFPIVRWYMISSIFKHSTISLY